MKTIKINNGKFKGNHAAVVFEENLQLGGSRKSGLYYYVLIEGYDFHIMVHNDDCKITQDNGNFYTSRPKFYMIND